MALLPPGYLDALVALGVPMEDGNVQYTATGFLYGIPSGEDKRYRIFLVTNRHVIEGKNGLKARMNLSEGSTSQTYDIPLGPDSATTLAVHDGHDVAAIAINARLLKEAGIALDFIKEEQGVTLEKAEDLEVSEGDGVFILGFPMGLAGEDRNYAIVRQGVVARARDWLKGTSQGILIDAFIFPGNSGGPVITKPENFSIKGTKNNSRALLLGMVSSYLPYEDIAVSKQTGRVRVIFQENSGLATVVPVDVIRETVEAANKKLVAAQQREVSAPEGRPE